MLLTTSWDSNRSLKKRRHGTGTKKTRKKSDKKANLPPCTHTFVMPVKPWWTLCSPPSSLPPNLKLRKSWFLPIDGSETVISTHLLSLTISHKYLLLDTGEDRWHGKPQLSPYKHRVLSKHLSLSLFCWLLTGLCLWKGLQGHSSCLPALIILCQCVIMLQGLKKISVATIRFFCHQKIISWLPVY